MSFSIGNVLNTFTQAASLLDPLAAGAMIASKVIDAATQGQINPAQLLNLGTTGTNSGFDASSVLRALAQRL